MKQNIKKYIKEYYKYYFLIIIIALIVCSGLLMNGIPNGHDLHAHMARAVGMSKEIAEGQFPPLVVSNLANGFGYAWNLFYPPLAPYLMAIIQIFVFSYVNALKLLLILSFIVAGISMFKLVEEITSNKNTSLLASIIYICSPYILTDMYIRMSVGEILGYAFLPILFIGIYNLFEKDGNKHILITVGAVSILLSHNISAVFAVLLSGIYVIFNLNKLNKNILKKIGINVVFIILIVLFFYLPFLEGKSFTDYKVFTGMSSTEELKSHSINISQLLFGKMQYGNSEKIENTNLNIENDMCMQIGLFIVIPVLFTPFVYKDIKKENRKNYILTIVTGLLFTFAVTPLFPYEIMPEQVSVIQFPWRLLLIVTFLWSIIAAVNIQKLFKKIEMKEIMVMTIFILTYIAPLIFANTYYEGLTDDKYTQIDKFSETTTYSDGCAWLEYLPKKAFDNYDYLRNRNQEVAIIEGDIDITKQEKQGSSMIIEYENHSENSKIELPYLYYPGYEIKINGQNSDYYESEMGFIELAISENTNGEITVKYTGTRLARITWIVSLIFLILFIIYSINLCIKCQKMKKEKNINHKKYLVDKTKEESK